MADYTTKRIDDMEAIFGGSFRKARSELGVTSFGMQVIDMPPNGNQYPEHDHAESGQEEVFVTISGRSTITVDGEDVDLSPDVVIRVGAGTRRKIVTGDEPTRILALGATPGKAYEVIDFTEVGAPDPFANQGS